MEKHQVIFFGTSIFAVPALYHLTQDKDCQVVLVVTQPDRPAGRGQKPASSPVKDAALSLDLPVLQPETIKGNELFTKTVAGLQPDVFVVASYGNILPADLLAIPRYGAFNIHPSLLPKYRGATPVQQTLLNGDTETGMAIIKMNERMDEGDILIMKRLPIAPDDTAVTLMAKLAAVSGKFIGETIRSYINGNLTPIKQDNERATYCQKIAKEDGRIDWKAQTAEEIVNRIRAFDPWPGVYTTWNSKQLKILAAKAEIAKKNVSDGMESAKLKPGALHIENDTIAIGTKNGSLIPTMLQLEGKKPVDAKAFINGYRSQLQQEKKIQ